jgi:hypothetical protein
VEMSRVAGSAWDGIRREMYLLPASSVSEIAVAHDEVITGLKE